MKVINVGSAQELEDLALDLGATVTYSDGRVYNAGANDTRIKTKPVPPVPDPIAKLAQAVERLAQQKPPQVTVPAPVVHVSPPPAPNVVVNETKTEATAWRFELERASDGTLLAITARPVKR